MKIIPVKNCTEQVTVSDQDYDRVMQHSWFFSVRHVMAKLSFLTGQEKPPTYSKNIPLERFITGISANATNVRFLFRYGHNFNFERTNIFLFAKDEGTKRKPRSMYLFVEYIGKRPGEKLWYTSYKNPKTGNLYSHDSCDEKELAQLHDQWVLNAEGPKSKNLNFLQPVVVGRVKKEEPPKEEKAISDKADPISG